jgi:hypothetical protein
MEQALIFALGAFPAAGEDSIVVSKRVASDPAVRFGNHDLDKEDIASLPDAVPPAIQVTVIERRCRLIGQTIGMSPEHLFPTSGT